MSAVSPEALAASAKRAVAHASTWRSSRGWLMRRLLLLADVVGLVTAFVVAQRIVAAPTPIDTVVPQWELVLFCASLPLWVILARLHGLYDRDEERTDHSSVDDFFGVLQMVTIGTWVFPVGTHVIQLAHPTLERLDDPRMQRRRVTGVKRRVVAVPANVVPIVFERNECFDQHRFRFRRRYSSEGFDCGFREEKISSLWFDIVREQFLEKRNGVCIAQLTERTDGFL